MKNSILRDFFKYTTANMIAMMGVSLYILADTFFIARALGPVGLTALNFAIVIYSLVQGMGLMIATGGAIEFSVRLHKGAAAGDKPFRHALAAAALVSLVSMILALTAPEAIARLLGADGITMAPTRVYVALILGFAPAFILNNILIAFVRNDGAPNLAMGAMILSSLTNIILDWIFMFPLGMGMFGAALATGLSPLVSIAILLVFGRKTRRFHWSRGAIELSRMAHLLKLGVPALITELAAAVTLFTFNRVILDLAGNLGVAAYGIVANVAIIATALYTGLGQGIQPLASQYHARRETQSLSRLLLYALSAALVVAVLSLIFIWFFTPQVAGVFNEDQDPGLAAMAESGLRIYFTGFLLAGLNVVVIAFLSATLKTRRAVILSLLRSSLILIPAVLILARWFGLTGIWSSFLVTEVLVGILAWLSARREQSTELTAKTDQPRSSD